MQAGCGDARGGLARPPPRDPDSPALTVDVLPVADVLQVAARVLAAQVRVGPVGLQPGVGIPPELGAGRHAARGSVPHLRWPPDSCCSRLPPRPRERGAGGGGVEGRPARPPPREGAEAAAGPRVSSGGGGGASPWAAAATSGRRPRLPRLPRLPLGLCARPPWFGGPVRGGGALGSARLRPPSLAHPAAAMAGGAAQAASPPRASRSAPGAPAAAAASARGSGSSGGAACPCGTERRAGVGTVVVPGAAEPGAAREDARMPSPAVGARPRPRRSPRPAPSPPLPSALEADRRR